MANVPPMAVTCDVNPAVAILRRAKLAAITERLIDQIEQHHLPALERSDVVPTPVPVERLPLLAGTLRELAEVEAVLAGIEAQQPGDATTVD